MYKTRTRKGIWMLCRKPHTRLTLDNYLYKYIVKTNYKSINL